MADPSLPGRFTAWNGIRLHVPESWHPAVILKDYLLFEEQYRPVFELKWQQIRGRFNPRRLISRLQKKQPDQLLVDWELPPLWRQSLVRFSAHGLHWHGDGSEGYGALLYCRECSRAILLQFHGTVALDAPFVSELLGSLQDHTADQMQPWAIFDIRAELPVTATLLAQEFLPGRFTLSLDIDGQVLTLLRFKPAAELLRNQTLLQFGVDLTGIPNTGTHDDPFTVQLQQYRIGLHRLLAKLRRQPSDHSLYLRHITENNVILGIRAQGRRPIAPELLHAITSHFAPV